MQDKLYELKRMEQSLQAMQRLLTESFRAPPRHSDGSDQNMIVRLSVDSNGLPEVIEISQNWQQRISADRLGDAVMSAALEAMMERSRRWAKDFQLQDWRGRLDGFKKDIEQADHADSRSAQDLANITFASHPRDVSSVLEDILCFVEEASSSKRAGASLLDFTGVGAMGKVAVTISRRGLRSCEVDPEWADGQSGSQVSKAVGAALVAARASLAQGSQGDMSHRAQALLDEAMAVLQTRKG
jgi:DNA-binding protein YbaB